MQRLQKLITTVLKGKLVGPSREYPLIFLTYEVVNLTAQLVASFGTLSQPHEGIVYWAGIPSPLAFVITTVLAPEADTTPGSYSTSVSANANVIKFVNEYKLQILAQVHGHPTDWVDHSAGDIRGAFMPYDGYYSVILPWYGRRGMLPLSKCGIHRYEDGQFIRLDENEVGRKFIVVPRSIDLRKTLTPP